MHDNMKGNMMSGTDKSIDEFDAMQINSNNLLTEGQQSNNYGISKEGNLQRDSNLIMRKFQESILHQVHENVTESSASVY